MTVRFVINFVLLALPIGITLGVLLGIDSQRKASGQEPLYQPGDNDGTGKAPKKGNGFTPYTLCNKTYGLTPYTTGQQYTRKLIHSTVHFGCTRTLSDTLHPLPSCNSSRPVGWSHRILACRATISPSFVAVLPVLFLPPPHPPLPLPLPLCRRGDLAARHTQPLFPPTHHPSIHPSLPSPHLSPNRASVVVVAGDNMRPHSASPKVNTKRPRHSPLYAWPLVQVNNGLC